MSFMEKQIEFGKWIEVDTTHGIFFIPANMVGTLEYDEENEEYTDEAKKRLLPYLEVFKIEDIHSIEERKGFGARMSAPGYLDCTEWSVFDTEQEAEQYLDDYYGDEEAEDEE